MAPTGAEVAAGEHALTDPELEFFEREGFLAIPGCMSAEHSELVKADIDAQMERHTVQGDSRNSSPSIAETEHLGGLTVFAPIVERVAQLMAAHEPGKPTFSFHHQHAARFDKGAGPADWHHDYEQFPQIDRELLMVHCFYYPNGLNGEVGDLIVQPRSHKVVMDRGRDVFGHLFGDAELPNSLAIDNLPVGSVVIVHSALMHGRRTKAGGEGGRNASRFFTDISYCQHPSDERKWPCYQVASRQIKGAEGGQSLVYAAHAQHRRHESAMATKYGIFDLSVFWDMTDATPDQLAALAKSYAGGRSKRRAKI